LKRLRASRDAALLYGPCDEADAVSGPAERGPALPAPAAPPLPQPVKRPKSWGGELPDDPIAASQRAPSFTGDEAEQREEQPQVVPTKRGHPRSAGAPANRRMFVGVARAVAASVTAAGGCGLSEGGCRGGVRAGGRGGGNDAASVASRCCRAAKRARGERTSPKRSLPELWGRLLASKPPPPPPPSTAPSSQLSLSRAHADPIALSSQVGPQLLQSSQPPSPPEVEVPDPLVSVCSTAVTDAATLVSTNCTVAVAGAGDAVTAAADFSSTCAATVGGASASGVSTPRKWRLRDSTSPCTSSLAQEEAKQEPSPMRSPVAAAAAAEAAAAALSLFGSHGGGCEDRGLASLPLSPSAPPASAPPPPRSPEPAPAPATPPWVPVPPPPPKNVRSSGPCAAPRPGYLAECLATGGSASSSSSGSRRAGLGGSAPAAWTSPGEAADAEAKAAGPRAVRLRCVRLTVLATRSSNTAAMQLGEVLLRCGGGGSLDLSGFSVTNPGGQNPHAEGPEKVVSSRGKWLDQNFRVRGKSVLLLSTPDAEGVEVTHLALRTASDLPGRDPCRIFVEGLPPTAAGAAGGGRWLPLFGSPGGVMDEGYCELPTERRALSTWLPLQPLQLQQQPIAPATTQARQLTRSPPVATPLRAALSRRSAAASASTSTSAAESAAGGVGGASGSAGRTVAPASSASSAPRVVPLSGLSERTGGEHVDVEAWVHTVGELETKELPLQPGEYMMTRSLKLRQGSETCLWTLWAEDAVRFGIELRGRRVRVRGARVHKFCGESRLTGCIGVDTL